jgi:PhnB protein
MSSVGAGVLPLETDGGLVLMAADTPSAMPYKRGDNHWVSQSGEDERELRGYWDRLADGGTVIMPLEKAPWGDTFGMCTDKFGVSWLVNIAGTGPYGSSRTTASSSRGSTRWGI